MFWQQSLALKVLIILATLTYRTKEMNHRISWDNDQWAMETSDRDKSSCTDPDCFLRPANVKIQISQIRRFYNWKSLQCSSSFHQAILHRATHTALSTSLIMCFPYNFVSLLTWLSQCRNGWLTYSIRIMKDDRCWGFTNSLGLKTFSLTTTAVLYLDTSSLRAVEARSKYVSVFLNFKDLSNLQVNLKSKALECHICMFMLYVYAIKHENAGRQHKNN